LKLVRTLSAFVIAVMLSVTTVSAAPYQNYVYNANQEPEAEPQAYVPEQVYNGASFGVSGFSGPQDIFLAESGLLYVADTGNNRIVICNLETGTAETIDRYVNNGAEQSFASPSGIFVTQTGTLYIADTQNQQIVVLNKAGELITIIQSPTAMGEKLDFEYMPTDVVVDFAGRVYVVSQNCLDGILQFDADGSYMGHFGAIRTNPTATYLFWKSLASEEQRESMTLVVPTEYSGIDVDADGFVYGTVSAVDTTNLDKTMFVHRLNSLGKDVLKRNGVESPMGDLKYTYDSTTGTYDVSRLNDICVQEYGFYSVLDSNKGRIFTYNKNGDLLYIFGAKGAEGGQFGDPKAIDADKSNRMFVLDAAYNQIVTFVPTIYATTIRSAYVANYTYDYDAAEKLWFAALKYTSKSDLVFREIGKLYIDRGDYEKAMEYLNLAGDRENYSEAYKHTRKATIERWFAVGIIGILAVVILCQIIKRIRANRKRY